MGFDFFFVFVQRVVAQVGIKNKRKMSGDDSETLYSESERSCDSDSEGSLADFVVDDDDELVEACTCRAEICSSNVINRKRRHESSSYEEASDDEEESDSSSDYVPSEGDGSSSDESDC